MEWTEFFFYQKAPEARIIKSYFEVTACMCVCACVKVYIVKSFVGSIIFFCWGGEEMAFSIVLKQFVISGGWRKRGRGGWSRKFPSHSYSASSNRAQVANLAWSSPQSYPQRQYLALILNRGIKFFHKAVDCFLRYWVQTKLLTENDLLQLPRSFIQTTEQGSE